MRVLVIGGTGLISLGIIKHLLRRKADVTMYNRGKRNNPFADEVKVICGDRDKFADFKAQFAKEKFDAVIDMVCFTPEQAQSVVETFGGRCQQFIFCSTVCTYGTKYPHSVLIDENFPQEPTSGYGRGKLECERIFLQAHREKAFNATIVRPSLTYGPGSPLVDQLEFNPSAWDRIERGLPVLVAGDGLALIQPTHRDDCGKFFAYSVLNPKTYGESFNATSQEIMAWRDFYRTVAKALKREAQLLFVPTHWLLAKEPERFGGLLGEILQYHGVYTSQKARETVPEFVCEIPFGIGAAQTLADVRTRNAWKSSADDGKYQALVDEALRFGLKPQK